MPVDVAIGYRAIKPGIPHALFKVNVGGWPARLER